MITSLPLPPSLSLSIPLYLSLSLSIPLYSTISLSIPLYHSLPLSIPLYPFLSVSIPLYYLCYTGPYAVPGAIATAILVDSSAIAVTVAVAHLTFPSPSPLLSPPHICLCFRRICMSINPSAHLMQPENNYPYLLRIQATKAARRKVILQVAQSVIMLPVGG